MQNLSSKSEKKCSDIFTQKFRKIKKKKNRNICKKLTLQPSKKGPAFFASATFNLSITVTKEDFGIDDCKSAVKVELNAVELIVAEVIVSSTYMF